MRGFKSLRRLQLLSDALDIRFVIEGTIKEGVLRALDPMLSLLGLPGFDKDDRLAVDDRFIGPGYGVASAESAEASQLLADTEGVLLDPVYTSKAAAGLIAYCREGRFRATDRVLFWHTGGLMTLL